MIDKKLKEAKDYVRFNAKKLTDIHPLLVEVIADTFNLIVDIPEFKNGIFRDWNSYIRNEKLKKLNSIC